MAFKKSMQLLLGRVGLYDRVKASYLYDLYWGIADKDVIRRRHDEVVFYRDVLGGPKKGDLIFDIGANQGYKTDIFARLGARVVAVDPDESNQDTLRSKFLQYRLVRKPVTIVGKAVSDKCGFCKMWVDEPGSAKNTLNGKWVETLRRDSSRFGHCLDFKQQRLVESISLEDLIATYGRPLFIKVDVEGHESKVLAGLKKPVPYLSFEVNLPEFRDEGIECVEHLQNIDPKGTFNYVVDCSTGLALNNWMSANRFQKLLESCIEPSVEVFWRTVQHSPNYVPT